MWISFWYHKDNWQWLEKSLTQISSCKYFNFVMLTVLLGRNSFVWWAWGDYKYIVWTILTHQKSFTLQTTSLEKYQFQLVISFCICFIISQLVYWGSGGLSKKNTSLASDTCVQTVSHGVLQKNLDYLKICSLWAKVCQVLKKSFTWCALSYWTDFISNFQPVISNIRAVL